MILLEDGIALWLSLLENAPLSTPSFIAMFEWLSALLQLGSDSLKTSLLIIDCSILLDPPATVSVSSLVGIAGFLGGDLSLFPISPFSEGSPSRAVISDLDVANVSPFQLISIYSSFFF